MATIAAPTSHIRPQRAYSKSSTASATSSRPTRSARNRFPFNQSLFQAIKFAEVEETGEREDHDLAARSKFCGKFTAAIEGGSGKSCNYGGPRRSICRANDCNGDDHVTTSTWRGSAVVRVRPRALSHLGTSRYLQSAAVRRGNGERGPVCFGNGWSSLEELLHSVSSPILSRCTELMSIEIDPLFPT